MAWSPPSNLNPTGEFSQFSFGTGISTPSNPLVGMLGMMLLGGQITPRPSSSGQSIMMASMQRQRSLNFMTMQRLQMANLASTFGKPWGMGDANGLLPYGMQMYNAMTGGSVSSAFAPLMGGDPVLAQQKLYAGLHGMTTASGFGLRGEVTLGQTNAMMRGLQNVWFNNPNATTMGQLQNGLLSGAPSSVTSDQKAAIVSALNSADAKKAVGDLFTGALRDSVKPGSPFAQQIEATASKIAGIMSTGPYGGINFQNTFGYKQEDMTGAFVRMNQLSMYRRTGSMDGALADFITNKGGGMMRASQTLLGGDTGADIISRLNDFMGVSRVNFATPGGINQMTDLLQGLQATSYTSGIDKSALVNLVMQAQQMAQRGPMGASLGGAEATNLVQRAVSNVQTMLLSGGNPNDVLQYSRQHGGTGGMVQEQLQGLVGSQTNMASQMAYGLLGTFDRLGGPGGKIVQDYLRGGDMSQPGFYNMLRGLSKATGMSVMSLQANAGTAQFQARGMDIANADPSLNTSKLNAGGFSSMMKQLLVAGLVNKDGRPVTGAEAAATGAAVDRALSKSANLAEFRDNMNTEMQTITGSKGFFTGQAYLRDFIESHPAMLTESILAKNPQAAAIAKETARQTAAVAAGSKMLEANFSQLRNSAAGIMLQGLADGTWAKGGTPEVFRQLTGQLPAPAGIVGLLESLGAGDVVGVATQLGVMGVNADEAALMSNPTDPKSAAMVALRTKLQGNPLYNRVFNKDGTVNTEGWNSLVGATAQGKLLPYALRSDDFRNSIHAMQPAVNDAVFNASLAMAKAGLTPTSDIATLYGERAGLESSDNPDIINLKNTLAPIFKQLDQIMGVGGNNADKANRELVGVIERLITTISIAFGDSGAGGGSATIGGGH